jgi:hypothetical protein
MNYNRRASGGPDHAAHLLRVRETTRNKRRRLAGMDAPACEVCGWRPPPDGVLPGKVSLLEAHHVVPVSCGGTHEEDNLVLLCPTCHALADRLGRRRRKDGEAVSFAPRTREALVSTLRHLRDDPEGWAREHQAEVARLVAARVETWSGSVWSRKDALSQARE